MRFFSWLLASILAIAPTFTGAAVQTKQAEQAAQSLIEAGYKPWQIVLFTIPGCSACITMREQVIGHLIETGKLHPQQFTEALQHTDADWYYVRGVGQQQIRDAKKRYQTSLFPTLVFIDMQGNKIADNIVGVTSVEHYRDKLEKRIELLNARDY